MSSSDADRIAEKISTFKAGGGSSGSAGTNIFRSVCVYILVSELCERLAYYGLTGSLSIFISEQLGANRESASLCGPALPIRALPRPASRPYSRGRAARLSTSGRARIEHGESADVDVRIGVLRHPHPRRLPRRQLPGQSVSA